MSRERYETRRAARWMSGLVGLALVVGGCNGGVDEDRGRRPVFIPPDQSPLTGQITLELERTRIPADGLSLVEVVAYVRDGQGRPIDDTFVFFTSEFEDVTWLTAQRDTIPIELSPAGALGLFGFNECTEFTNEDGRASCILRAGYTPGSTVLRAEAPDVLLRATEEVLFTDAGVAPGIAVSFADCPENITAEELPTEERLLLSVTQIINSEVIGDPATEPTVRPVQGAQIYLSTTNGRFRRGSDRIQITTDSFGQAEVDLELSESSRDTTVRVLAGVTGALPVVCTITVGDYEPPTLSLLLSPMEVQAGNPDKQIIGMGVLAEPVPAFNNSDATFGSPIGSFSPNPAGLDPNTGLAETIWTVDPSESFSLTAGQSIPVVVTVDFGGNLPAQLLEDVPVIDFAPRAPEEGEGGEEEPPPAEEEPPPAE